MRTGEIKRATAETDISLSLCLDGGEVAVDTGAGFLDHMLTLFARHAGFGLRVVCRGDTNVDFHHTTEDVGICLGKAVAQALGSMSGIARYASLMLPMDESLVLCALDISGRAYLSCRLDTPTARVGDFDAELVDEFFLGFVRNANVTLHLKKLDGQNTHHIIEAAFKAFGRALAAAASPDSRFAGGAPSTKGVL